MDTLDSVWLGMKLGVAMTGMVMMRFLWRGIWRSKRAGDHKNRYALRRPMQVAFEGTWVMMGVKLQQGHRWATLHRRSAALHRTHDARPTSKFEQRFS